jgi:hypothetical protein
MTFAAHTVSDEPAKVQKVPICQGNRGQTRGGGKVEARVDTEWKKSASQEASYLGSQRDHTRNIIHVSAICLLAVGARYRIFLGKIADYSFDVMKMCSDTVADTTFTIASPTIPVGKTSRCAAICNIVLILLLACKSSFIECDSSS